MAGAGPDDAPFCRICHETAEEGDLLQPCNCTGSMRHVHLACLQAWRAHARDPCMCGVCRVPYRLPVELAVAVVRPRQRRVRSGFGTLLGWLVAGAVVLLGGWEAYQRSGWHACKRESERREMQRRQLRRLHMSLSVRQPAVTYAVQAGITGRFAFDAWQAARRRGPY